MQDQELDASTRERLTCVEQSARRADIGKAADAIIEATRRAWASPPLEAPEASTGSVIHVRFAHPLIRFALDAKRSNSWRARIGRQAWIQSVVRLAELDRTPEGTS